MGRMRRKKNLLPRMERCAAYQITAPLPAPGSWRTAFGVAPEARLALEIGCGKGGFAVKTAQANPEQYLIAMDRVNEALIVGMERAMAEDVSNVRFLSSDCVYLDELFAPGEVDVIYLNFSDPWPNKRHAKRRLTYRDFLARYHKVLRPDGMLYFKTDNRDLFDFSLVEFEESNLFDLSGITNDLHATDIPNITTEYEEKFSAAGVPINRLAAQKKEKAE
ncbi:MAG: tRNA (guanosine(46)-N7)-methyltransferase TrmB [Clostridia bacterium]|nr:tRNA (guanosine(46)-N7)-methyltransferase TrmB [Clostridia bacterium]